MTDVLDAFRSLLTGPTIFAEVAQIAEAHSDAADFISEHYGFSRPTATKLVTASKNWAAYDDSKGLARGVSIPVLILISQAMNLLHADEDKEEFRNTILDFADHGATSWKDVKAHIKKIAGTKQARKVSNSVTFSKTTDITGMQHAHIRLNPELMATFRATLKDLGEKWTALPSSYRYAEGLRTLLLKHTSPRDTDEVDPWDRTMMPAFMLTVEDGKYVGDGMFATTDGTLINGEELANIKLAPFGLVTIYDEDGNIGCHYQLKNQRLASKQLLSAIACDQIFCSHPGCYNLAQYSQGHHSIAWSQGGETTAEVIISACKFHNLHNDDDPTKPPKYGRHVRDPETKEAVFLPPDGSPTKRHKNHCREYSGRGLYLRHRSRKKNRPAHQPKDLLRRGNHRKKRRRKARRKATIL